MGNRHSGFLCIFDWFLILFGRGKNALRLFLFCWKSFSFILRTGTTIDVSWTSQRAYTVHLNFMNLRMEIFFFSVDLAFLFVQWIFGNFVIFGSVGGFFKLLIAKGLRLRSFLQMNISYSMQDAWFFSWKFENSTLNLSKFTLKKKSFDFKLLPHLNFPFSRNF